MEDFLSEVPWPCPSFSLNLFTFFFTHFNLFLYLGTIFIHTNSLQPQCFSFFSFILVWKGWGQHRGNTDIGHKLVSSLMAGSDGLSLQSTLGRRDGIKNSYLVPTNTKKKNKQKYCRDLGALCLLKNLHVSCALLSRKQVAPASFSPQTPFLSFSVSESDLCAKMKKSSFLSWPHQLFSSPLHLSCGFGGRERVPLLSACVPPCLYTLHARQRKSSRCSLCLLALPRPLN